MNNDMISREVLLDVFDSFRDKQKGNPVFIWLEHVIAIIEEVCAVDAEPVRHAKWVWDNDAIDWNLGAWVCSECRHRNENIHAGMPGINGGVWSNPYIWSGSNYCPNCGAKMKEGD